VAHDDNYESGDTIILLLLSLNRNIAALPGSLLSGFVIYFVFSYLLIPIRITVPASIIMSILVFGLIKYYGNEKRLSSSSTVNTIQPNLSSLNKIEDDNDHILVKQQYNNGIEDYHSNRSFSSLFFVSAYIILLVILSFFSTRSSEIFVAWDQFSPIKLPQLGAAVALSFFMPGYALVTILDRKHELEPILKTLLAYTFSILITGLTGYITASLGLATLNIRMFFIAIYLLILVVFVQREVLNKNPQRSFDYKFTAVQRVLRRNSSEILVFASLFALIILSTYYLLNGVIIGDQWFHHGRSLIFMSGAFKDLAAAGIDELYPPFLSSLLASFFTLSGVPSVNAYVSISFLNIIPVFAFYYFFTKWIPSRNRKAVLLSSALFMLSSGFGWAHILNAAVTTGHITSQISSLDLLTEGGIKTFDIRLPNAFIDVSSPDITTGLIIIGLPAGFILLGLIREIINSKFKYILILTAISTLGVFSHDEFYFFIIIASILPIVFRLDAKSSLYAAILSALLITILTDIIFPGKYYTVREIFGIPLIFLTLLFVILMWILYVGGIVYRIHFPKTMRVALKRIIDGSRFNFALGVVTVSIVAYLYVFTFIVWGQLSIGIVQAHTVDNGQRIVPWYLYPMRLGVAGLFGLAFILSYLFKRYEKEVFIFGIIAIVSFLLGPYYDVYRFNKYIMVGMVGFASILIYKILFFIIQNLKFRTLVCGILIGIIITSSGLSVLMYAGYTALGLENPNYRPFNLSLGQRHFPSPSDMRLINFLHNQLINPKTDFVTAPANEFAVYQGLIAKLEGFVSTSITKFSQSPLTLNSSTLEGLYNLLDYGDTRYIILPKKSIHSAGLPGTIIDFALQNFKKSYEDDDYIVLAVPSLAPPSSKGGDIALIYQKNEVLSSISSKKILPYNNGSFIIGGNSNFNSSNNNNPTFARAGNIALENNNSNTTKILRITNNTNTAILYGNSTNQAVIWSKPIQQPINYIEGKFRVVEENLDSDTDNHAGIVWFDGHKVWYAFLRDRSISIYNSIDKEFAKDNTIIREKGVWYTIKIAFMKNTTDIYLNDELRLQIPKTPADNNAVSPIDISRVGIRSDNDVAEFEPIKIGQISNTSEQSYQNYHHYYPLSMLALSKVGYDTFINGDFSAFAKKYVILAFDPLNYEEKYLEFARSGGTLVIMNTNTDSNFQDGFSKLLSIQPSSNSRRATTEFDSIMSTSPHSALNISGIAKDIELKPSWDMTVKSYYIKNKQIVAPFSIEKKYGNGKIIFVNISGYFDALSKSPDKFFLTLADIPSLIGIGEIIDNNRYIKPHIPNAILPTTRFIGDLDISGQAVINSSSLLFGGELPAFYADNISVSDQKGIHLNNNQYVKTEFRNVPIKDLKLYNSVEVIINSTGLSYLPSSPLSQYDYTAISIPAGSDITLKVSNGSSADFMIGNYPQHHARITNGEIQFHKVKSVFPSAASISILTKDPEIKINGKTSFKELYSTDPNDVTKSLANGDQVETTGKLVIKLDHVDKYYGVNGVRYITYLKSIKFNVNRNTNLDQVALKIPGDVSKYAKKKGIEIPWRKALISDTSVKAMFTIATISIAASILYKDYEKKREERNNRKHTLT
jgi:hypothetical protein